MVDMCTNYLFNEIALGVYNGLDPLPEPVAGPGHDDWVQVGHDLLMAATRDSLLL